MPGSLRNNQSSFCGKSNGTCGSGYPASLAISYHVSPFRKRGRYVHAEPRDSGLRAMTSNGSLCPLSGRATVSLHLVACMSLRPRAVGRALSIRIQTMETLTSLYPFIQLIPKRRPPCWWLCGGTCVGNNSYQANVSTHRAWPGKLRPSA